MRSRIAYCGRVLRAHITTLFVPERGKKKKREKKEKEEKKDFFVLTILDMTHIRAAHGISIDEQIYIKKTTRKAIPSN
jgi:hypothetical protein